MAENAGKIVIFKHVGAKKTYKIKGYKRLKASMI